MIGRGEQLGRAQPKPALPARHCAIVSTRHGTRRLCRELFHKGHRRRSRVQLISNRSERPLRSGRNTCEQHRLPACRLCLSSRCFGVLLQQVRRTHRGATLTMQYGRPARLMRCAFAQSSFRTWPKSRRACKRSVASSAKNAPPRWRRAIPSTIARVTSGIPSRHPEESTVIDRSVARCRDCGAASRGFALS